MGQKKLILRHNAMKYGREQGHFLGKETLTYGHKTNFAAEEGDFLRQEKSIFGSFEMNYGTKQYFWGDRRSWYLGHNKMKYGTKRCDFWGQEMLILGHHEMNYGTKQGHLLG